ncbi:NAD(P)-dependent glyceraldehyde 3-phosphate dehydrogenase archaeal, partial [hydrothermal vent metagenome]
MNQVKIAVNGYGVIGKRVADAVLQQDDMTLIGVADVVTDYRIKAAVQKGIRVFSALPEKIEEMKSAGIPVAGTLDELLNSVDVVLDCTPKKIAALNKTRYEQVGVKSIYQGGESHALTGHSFVAQANYESALNRQSTRVVSCN